jgi:hypothetical protein
MAHCLMPSRTLIFILELRLHIAVRDGFGKWLEKSSTRIPVLHYDYS